MIVKSYSVMAIPPGETIKELLEDCGLTQERFATEMGMSVTNASRLINGEIELTPNVALRLETVLGISARFWSKLEAMYRENLKKAEGENAAEASIAEKIPYKTIAVV